MSLADIQKLIEDGNRKLREDMAKDFTDKIKEVVQSTIDLRLNEHEERLMAEIRALKDRTSTLETKMAEEPKVPSGNAWKRPRSEPPGGGKSQHTQDSQTAVLTGFPKNSRKKDIEEFLKQKLSGREEWKGYKGYAPNVRGTVGMIKMNTKPEVNKFINQWNSQLQEFNDEHLIRARFEKAREA